MATRRQLVNAVRSHNRLLSSDSYITDRVIDSEIRRTAALLIKRETDLRRLWGTDYIFDTIPCLEMKEVPISECCGYVDDCTIARSVLKLPRIAEGKFGYLIQGVYSINALSGKAYRLKEVNVDRYINLLKLSHVKKEVYYMLIDDYLYVTSPEVRAVRVSAYFDEDVPNALLKGNCSCEYEKFNVTDEMDCLNPLDRTSKVPSYLEKSVLDIVIQKLMSTYFRLPDDKSSNNVDGQARNSKPRD